jgi:hypothetical protein
MSKSITFDRPTKPATPESWVLARPPAPGEATKRLTVDVPEPLHHRIKVQCAIQGVNMADVVRELLEQRFPKAGK